MLILASKGQEYNSETTGGMAVYLCFCKHQSEACETSPDPNSFSSGCICFPGSLLSSCPSLVLSEPCTPTGMSLIILRPTAHTHFPLGTRSLSFLVLVFSPIPPKNIDCAERAALGNEQASVS
jgi:hypothetical protein